MKLKIAEGVLVTVIISVLVFNLMRKKDFLYSGTIEATEVDISSRVSSIIASVAVKEGEEATAGQLLLKLDDADFKLVQELARKDFERAEKLYKNGTLPKETYDRLEYKYKESALRLDWCTINSPLAGTVLDFYREPGEFVNPGMKLLTLADLREVWTMIYVPQPILTKISLGLKVEGLIPDLGRWLGGRITRINDEAEFTPKNVQTREERTRLIYGVKIAFQNPERILKPGMTVEVRLPK